MENQINNFMGFGDMQNTLPDPPASGETCNSNMMLIGFLCLGATIGWMIGKSW